MRDGSGKFIKGNTANTSGRPKSFKITDADRAEFGDDPHKALVFLMRKAESRDELFRYIKELMPYTKPRLSSVKQEVNEVKEIRLSWGGASKPFGSLEVNESRLIESSSVEEDMSRLELTKEDLTGIMTELTKKPKRGRPKKKRD